MNIYDISKKAGVSIATVSRVINGSENVSEKTREKVLAIMKETGYTPNVFARGLTNNTIQTIGLLCADCSDHFLATAISYLERGFRANGYDCILCCTGYELAVRQKYLQLMRPCRFRFFVSMDFWMRKIFTALCATMLKQSSLPP